MNNQAWEYRVVYLRNSDEAETLTHLGAESWELVAVLDWPAPYSAKAYLKRLCAARPTEVQRDAQEVRADDGVVRLRGVSAVRGDYVLEPFAGESIADAFEDARATAAYLHRAILVRGNGVEVCVTAGMSAADCKASYERALGVRDEQEAEETAP